MKFFKASMMLLLIVTMALFGCAEEEGMTTGQTEQEEQGAMEQAQTEGQGQPAPSPPMAQEETGQTTTPGMTQEQAQTETTSPQTGMGGAGEQIEVAGVVEQTADGFALRSVDESYQIEGGEDLSQMVGKDVKITGSLQESDGQRVINVEEVTVIE